MALVLSQSEVRGLLPMRTCMNLMREALATLGPEAAVNPLRWAMWLPGKQGLLGLMALITRRRI